MDLSQRFWSKVDIRSEDECWLWQGCLSKAGYGQIRFGGKLYYAHRVAYSMTYGEIPDRMEILHTCDFPRCCNPNHLQLGTHDDNMKDMAQKGRGARGSRNGHAQLTADDVRRIRLLAELGRTKRLIANEFGVNRRQISRIIHKERWGWLV